MEHEKVQILANKLDKIAESFGIAESTLDGLSDQVGKMITNVDNAEYTQDDSNSLDLVLQFNILKDDFTLVRNNLKNLIENSQTIMNNVQTAITLEGDLNPDGINSFVNLGNLINNSMKILMSNYNDLLKIESQIKERNKPKEDKNDSNIPTIGGGNQIIIATNTADLIANGLISGNGAK